MDNTQCHNLAELLQHLAQLSELTAELKMRAWESFSYEFERGKSQYVSNLLVAMGEQCNVVSGALKQIGTIGQLLQDELDKFEKQE